MSKLLPLAHKMRKDLNNLYDDDIEKFNIEPQLTPLYNTSLSPMIKNTILCYIILAYDNESDWMEMHKNRKQVKISILKRLGADVNHELYKKVLDGIHEPTQRIVSWFTGIYQTDWRWNQIRANFDYHAEMVMFAGMLTPDKLTYDKEEKDEEGNVQLVSYTEDIDMDKQIQNNIKKGQCLKAGTEARLEGEKLLKEIQTEFVALDTVLSKEGAVPVTKLNDIMSHEEFIASLRHDRETK